MIKVKKQNKNILALIAFVFVVVFLSKITNAQTEDFFGGNNIPVPEQIKEIKQQLDIGISPEAPKPGEDVTITIEAYGLDLNSIDIQWLVNGRQKLRGAGEKTFTFNVGNGGVSNVVVNIFPKNQPQITRTFTFNPSNIDLLWQAETYTPPFYKGKALFSPESSVTMVAIPNFVSGNSRVSDTNVVYKWSVDREVQGDNSGYGKNYFRYTSDIIPLDKTIDVEAYPSGQESRKGVGSTELLTKKSFVLFYEDNPTNGIMFNYSPTNQVDLGSRNESKISVFPYNFSINNKDSSLEYTWYINSEKIDIPNSTNSITIKRNIDQKVDTASLLVDIANPSHIMQATQNGVDFLFNNNQ
jgi:hypothetical protein